MKVKETTELYTTKKKRFTYRDYLNLPDDGQRYEIIHGDLVMTPAPVPLHQMVSGNIFNLLSTHVKNNQLGFVLYAPCDVVLDELNVVQPDILFITRERAGIITEKNIQGAPDLIIEIISPATAYYDLVSKKDVYQQFGVKEYWLVDPIRRSVQVLVLTDGKWVVDQEVIGDGSVASRLLPEFRLSLSAIFPQLPESAKENPKSK